MRTFRPLSLGVAGAAIWGDGIAALNVSVRELSVLQTLVPSGEE
jgi:hypothetical protein